ncbi:MAG TPA: CsgG/HfaB family protein, partial [Syntrophorhabdaceae bacterium]|nr:CsgG/HfaB family protein [Syntrophorhabdaceae bacterium]
MKRPSFLVITLSLILLGLSTTPLYAKQLNILVYPFENTGDKRYSWISAGMTHTVITDLANIRGIGVVSDADRKRIMEEIKLITSGLTKEETMIKLGQLTGANIIFTGSYLVVGENIRVTAHLLNVETGKIESAIKIDGAIDKIFDLQDKVVLSLLKDTEKVELPDIKPPVIKQEDKTRIIEKKRPDLKAYELYARGLELHDTNPKTALDYYKKALEIDKYYVDALISAGYVSGRIFNRFNEAMVYLNRAEKTLKEKRETNTDGYADLMLSMGVVYGSKGQLDKAL